MNTNTKNYNVGMFVICNEANSLNSCLDKNPEAAEGWKYMIRRWFNEYFAAAKKLGLISSDKTFDPDEKYIKVWAVGEDWMDGCGAEGRNVNLSDHGISEEFADALGIEHREGTHHLPFLHFLPASVAKSLHEGDVICTNVQGKDVTLTWEIKQNGRRGSQFGDWGDNVAMALGEPVTEECHKRIDDWNKSVDDAWRTILTTV